MISKIFGFLRKKENYLVYGEQGGISTTMTLPEGFDPKKDHCPMVVLMHGFMSSKKMHPIPELAAALAREGIASISFDFNAHGKSEGNFIDMTIANETADAKAVLKYVKGLSFVTEIGFLGHSQGGVIAGMLAGQLENDPMRPKCLALLAPAAVLKDDALAGQCMNARYDAANPPAYVNVMFHKLGRTFILAAQKLDIYGVSCRYTGNVCLIHGSNDKIVPLSYGEKYDATYQNSVLHVIEGEGHFMRKYKDEIIGIAVDFMKENLL